MISKVRKFHMLCYVCQKVQLGKNFPSIPSEDQHHHHKCCSYLDICRNYTKLFDSLFSNDNSSFMKS